MRAITLLVSGIFLTSALAATALPLSKPQAGDHAVQVQQKKDAKKKKNEPAKPKEQYL
jgi:hypothetical protein